MRTDRTSPAARLSSRQPSMVGGLSTAPLASARGLWTTRPEFSTAGFATGLLGALRFAVYGKLISWRRRRGADGSPVAGLAPPDALKCRKEGTSKGVLKFN